MQMFLAQGVIEKFEYGETNHITILDIRLVQADDCDAALVKYYKFWNNKSRDYEVTYHVARIEMIETLV